MDAWWSSLSRQLYPDCSSSCLGFLESKAIRKVKTLNY